MIRRPPGVQLIQFHTNKTVILNNSHVTTLFLLSHYARDRGRGILFYFILKYVSNGSKQSPPLLMTE